MPFGKPKFIQAIKKIGGNAGPKPEPAPARIEHKQALQKAGIPDEDQINDYGFDAELSREVREFRQLLLELYKLNVYLSSLKRVYEANRRDVEDTRMKAQAALKELQITASGWHQNGRYWSPEEYAMVEEIVRRVSDMTPVESRYSNKNNNNNNNNNSLPRR